MEEINKILVVDDDRQLREILASELTEQGYDIREASSGYEAIPLAYGIAFKLIILDLKMPYIDGFDFLKFSKRTFPKTKVIVLTAYADLTNIQKCKDLGADEVIGKPYEMGYLLYNIENVLKE
ncbi:MAG: response regulator [Ignavibacteriales bacterium]|nr:response regulator [Ignavibacteriales bacterium]